MGRVSVQHLESFVTDVVKKNTLRKNADPVRDLSLSQDGTQDENGQIGSMEENAHTDVMYMKLKNVKMTLRT